MQTPTATKRDASVQSPLEGNPEKKQCDSTAKKTTRQRTLKKNNIKHTQSKHQNSDEKCSENQSTNIDTQAENPPTQCIENDQNASIQTILHELKIIKETIVHLGTKVETSYKDLSMSSTKNTELKKVITTQNMQITMLLNDNKILKQQNKTLEKT